MNDQQTVPGGDFRLFLQKIAMQGFYALGMIDIPGVPKQDENLPLARTVIDDLMMLREKVGENLEKGERMTLDKYISDLQFQVVERSK
ncbi:MAG: DUF1844 domain-containing protein [Planctomycetota bacterium]|nr:DUF1844 domain-containing protein [Planctomycetota bacterium]MDA1113579.1 DUF1844 domain-containing protein [Planctomycetota bacterium]